MGTRDNKWDKGLALNCIWQGRDPQRNIKMTQSFKLGGFGSQKKRLGLRKKEI